MAITFVRTLVGIVAARLFRIMVADIVSTNELDPVFLRLPDRGRARTSKSYLLDTNVCIAILNGSSSRLVDRIRRTIPRTSR